jgi:hypothetical protein
MAGSFVKLLNPGYSALYTRDLPFLVNTNVDASGANVFNPDSTNPLQEGEWLSMSAGKFTRGAGTTGAVTAATGATRVTLVDDAQNDALAVPAHLYFQERGRYDAQLTRKAHCVIGPLGFEFRTQMIDCAAGDEGEKVYVLICEDSSGRLVQALVSSSVIAAASNANGGAAPAAGDGVWYAGVITQVHGNSDATVLFQPGWI